ncbi:TonB-dependent receptor [Lewinella sp. LCG006]|uniref:TonB-dependent receptor n=1 Tax=Lewinella sp. LCG006 TaxID=3231911 RepID=UPI00345F9913
MKTLLLYLFLLLCLPALLAQTGRISGTISADGQALGYTTIVLKNTHHGTYSGEEGLFELNEIAAGVYIINVSYLGYQSFEETIEVEDEKTTVVDIELEVQVGLLDQVVVTGTLKEVSRLESPVPVEVYTPAFFKKNPTSNIYEALQNVNGVRPQLNCQVCNTGDIHINGLEGPYTMVLIDGMPIVSSLATVYGLSGIPNSLIERMEIVKGPASSLYGSEAIGGLINIITKHPLYAPLVSADIMATSWQEYNVDLGLKLKLGKKISLLTGVNYFLFDEVVDNNDDNFTDLALQERVSVFQKWNIVRKSNRLLTLAGRYYYENRWGGELDWQESYRGGNEIYGESIYTERAEFLGTYQLPTKEKLLFSTSFNSHDQNSVYGDLAYLAKQKIAFGQLTWDKQLGKHDLLLGTALRYTFYDDNTPATGGDANDPRNNPDEIWLPGIFLQDEVFLHPQHKLLLGLRYDYNEDHGAILTPRFAYKWSLSDQDILRLNAGTGFRVINLFTEEHAALTGAREVVIEEQLAPEQSYNVNLNYSRKTCLPQGGFVGLELAAWYTHFTNVIYPDYETNANQIIYANLDGKAVTQGISANLDVSLSNGLSLLLGATFMDVSTEENGIKERQILTERFTGTWAITYPFWNNKLTFDYTGNVYGPMRLPLLGALDPRAPVSPVWSIQNIQFTYRAESHVEIYTGIKNLLNWTPWKNQEAPIIARAFDPFDRGVTFDNNGNALPTENNPHALTFDPSYVYGPNQGIRLFVGMRYHLE